MTNNINKLDNIHKRYSPRFVNFEEAVIYALIKQINEFDSSKKFNCTEYLDQALNIYYDININYPISDEAKSDRKSLSQFEEFKNIYEKRFNCLQKNSFEKKDYGINHFKLGLEKRNFLKKTIKIATTNLEVKEQNIIKAIIQKPDLSKERLFELRKLLNTAVKEKCDLIIFPEVSIPLNWLKFLVEFSKRNKIGIVGGLEHCINQYDYAFNFLLTLLPYTIDTHNGDYNSSLIKIRLKNNYAHEEIKLLKKYNKKIPTDKEDKAIYDIFEWNNIFFTCYNCFELANIQDRSLFLSNIDFMIASEWNSDTNYFSNIVESTSRDLHCYLVQVNTSQFGDTRIVAPKKTIEKDIIKIKGGDNSSILVGSLDIKSLRYFQIGNPEFQNQKDFKPLPPNFDNSDNNKRLNPKNWL